MLREFSDIFGVDLRSMMVKADVYIINIKPEMIKNVDKAKPSDYKTFTQYWINALNGDKYINLS